VARTRGKEDILKQLEGLSFIESLSSRFEVPERLVVYGVGGALAALILVICWMGFSQGDSPVEETIKPQAASALQSPPTQFSNAPETPVSDTLVSSPSRSCVVYVTGAVVNPGLFTLVGGGRVGDAVQAAGGFAPEAAAAVVNLAQPLADGMQIHIPRTDEVEKDAPESGAAVSGETTAPTAAPSAPGAQASGLVNINTADSATLQTLSGIGPATAQKIIDYRATNGPFSSKEELKQVSGIGEKKYAAIEARITV